MSRPGWYPDPAGAHGRYRYWNGESWSQQTTTTPAATPAPSPEPERGRGPRGHGGWWIALIALVVAGGLVAWFVTRAGTPTAAPVDTNTAAPTVSAWNETSTPSPSAPPASAAAPGPAVGVACPLAPPVVLAHTLDGRLHGGHLSVEKLPAPWVDDFTGFVDWSVDTRGQLLEIVPGWVSNSAVGGLLTSQGFTDPEQAAYAFLSCYATSSYYRGFTGRTDLASRPITVDGHPGWYLRSEVRVVYPSDPRIMGDVVDVVVVDTGDPTMLSYWEGNATIGDQPVQREIDQVRSSLRVGD